jgi:hypothetical protein
MILRPRPLLLRKIKFKVDGGQVTLMQDPTSIYTVS